MLPVAAQSPLPATMGQPAGGAAHLGPIGDGVGRTGALVAVQLRTLVQRPGVVEAFGVGVLGRRGWGEGNWEELVCVWCVRGGVNWGGVGWGGDHGGRETAEVRERRGGGSRHLPGGCTPRARVLPAHHEQAVKVVGDASGVLDGGNHVAHGGPVWLLCALCVHVRDMRLPGGRAGGHPGHAQTASEPKSHAPSLKALAREQLLPGWHRGTQARLPRFLFLTSRPPALPPF